MFAACGVPDDKFRPICSAVDKLDKVSNHSDICVCAHVRLCVFGVELKLSLECSTMTLPWGIGKELGPSELFVPSILMWYVAGPNFRYRCDGRMQLCFKETKILRKSRVWVFESLCLEQNVSPRMRGSSQEAIFGKKENIFGKFYLSKEFILTLLPYLSLSLGSDWRIDVPLWGRGGGLTKILCKALTCVILIKTENCISKTRPFEGTLFWVGQLVFQVVSCMLCRQRKCRFGSLPLVGDCTKVCVGGFQLRFN